MKRILVIILIFVFILPVFAAQFKSIDGRIDISAEVIQMSKTTLKAKNKINVKLVDKEGYTYKIKCSEMKMVVKDFSNQTSLENVDEFVCNGNVNFEIDAIDNSTVISHSKQAYLDKANSLLVLVGNVQIDYVSTTGEHITATGTKATIDLRTQLSNEEVLFSIEGDGEIKPVLSSDNTVGK